jgi:hypothetical protein
VNILYTRPIREVEVEIGSQYIARCRSWLEQQNCTISGGTSINLYKVTFPQGTIEQARAGQSGVYTQQTFIILPSGEELTLYIASPLNEEQHIRKTLGLPSFLFE